jgi:hypothetical protein
MVNRGNMATGATVEAAHARARCKVRLATFKATGVLARVFASTLLLRVKLCSALLICTQGSSTFVAVLHQLPE